MDAFDWRVSMAEVASDGPFSLFPGIDRTLTVIEGEGMELMIEGRPSLIVGAGADPVVFPGDVPTSAKLQSGPIRDLNVMTRRGRFQHDVRRISTSADLQDVVWTDIAIMLTVDTAEDGRRIVSDLVMNEHFEASSYAIEPRDGALCYLICLDEIR